nr:hypothetical protein [Streptomyces phaeolivaceus]
MGFSEIAEPDSVPRADLVVNREVDGDGLADTEAGSALVAGGRGPDGAFVGAERGECVSQAGGSGAGETSEFVQGLGGCGGEHMVLGSVVEVVGLRGEPGGQYCQDLGDCEVVGLGDPGQVGVEGFSCDRGDSLWQHRCPLRPEGERAGYPGWDLVRVLLRVGFLAVGRDQQVASAVQLAVEGSLASLEAEVGNFLEQD